MEWFHEYFPSDITRRLSEDVSVKVDLIPRAQVIHDSRFFCAGYTYVRMKTNMVMGRSETSLNRVTFPSSNFSMDVWRRVTRCPSF